MFLLLVTKSNQALIHDWGIILLLNYFFTDWQYVNENPRSYNFSLHYLLYTIMFAVHST